MFSFLNLVSEASTSTDIVDDISPMFVVVGNPFQNLLQDIYGSTDSDPESETDTEDPYSTRTGFDTGVMSSNLTSTSSSTLPIGGSGKNSTASSQVSSQNHNYIDKAGSAVKSSNSTHHVSSAGTSHKPAAKKSNKSSRATQVEIAKAAAATEYCHRKYKDHVEFMHFLFSACALVFGVLEFLLFLLSFKPHDLSIEFLPLVQNLMMPNTLQGSVSRRVPLVGGGTIGDSSYSKPLLGGSVSDRDVGQRALPAAPQGNSPDELAAVSMSKKGSFSNFRDKISGLFNFPPPPASGIGNTNDAANGDALLSGVFHPLPGSDAVVGGSAKLGSSDITPATTGYEISPVSGFGNYTNFRFQHQRVHPKNLRSPQHNGAIPNSSTSGAMFLAHVLDKVSSISAWLLCRCGRGSGIDENDSSHSQHLPLSNPLNYFARNLEISIPLAVIVSNNSVGSATKSGGGSSPKGKKNSTVEYRIEVSLTMDDEFSQIFSQQENFSNPSILNAAKTKKWLVQRRKSEFVDLHDKIREEFPSQRFPELSCLIPGFPAKVESGQSQVLQVSAISSASEPASASSQEESVVALSSASQSPTKSKPPHEKPFSQKERLEAERRALEMWLKLLCSFDCFLGSETLMRFLKLSEHPDSSVQQRLFTNLVHRVYENSKTVFQFEKGMMMSVQPQSQKVMHPYHGFLEKMKTASEMAMLVQSPSSQKQLGLDRNRFLQKDGFMPLHSSGSETQLIASTKKPFDPEDPFANLKISIVSYDVEILEGAVSSGRSPDFNTKNTEFQKNRLSANVGSDNPNNPHTKSSHFLSSVLGVGTRGKDESKHIVYNIKVELQNVDSTNSSTRKMYVSSRRYREFDALHKDLNSFFAGSWQYVNNWDQSPSVHTVNSKGLFATLPAPFGFPAGGTSKGKSLLQTLSPRVSSSSNSKSVVNAGAQSGVEALSANSENCPQGEKKSPTQQQQRTRGKNPTKSFTRRRSSEQLGKDEFSPSQKSLEGTPGRFTPDNTPGTAKSSVATVRGEDHLLLQPVLKSGVAWPSARNSNSPSPNAGKRRRTPPLQEFFAKSIKQQISGPGTSVSGGDAKTNDTTEAAAAAAAAGKIVLQEPDVNDESATAFGTPKLRPKNSTGGNIMTRRESNKLSVSPNSYKKNPHSSSGNAINLRDGYGNRVLQKLIPPLPSKMHTAFISRDYSFHQRRKADLEQWLRQLSCVKEVRNCFLFQEFLNLDLEELLSHHGIPLPNNQVADDDPIYLRNTTLTEDDDLEDLSLLLSVDNITPKVSSINNLPENSPSLGMQDGPDGRILKAIDAAIDSAVAGNNNVKRDSYTAADDLDSVVGAESRQGDQTGAADKIQSATPVQKTSQEENRPSADNKAPFTAKIIGYKIATEWQAYREKKYILYTIVVSKRGVEDTSSKDNPMDEWTVQRRFNDFEQLKRALCNHAGVEIVEYLIPPLPTKNTLGYKMLLEGNAYVASSSLGSSGAMAEKLYSLEAFQQIAEDRQPVLERFLAVILEHWTKYFCECEGLRSFLGLSV